MIYEFQIFMKKEFDMIDLDLMKYNHVIEVEQQYVEIFIFQKKIQLKMDKSKYICTLVEIGFKLSYTDKW